MPADDASDRRPSARRRATHEGIDLLPLRHTLRDYRKADFSLDAQAAVNVSLLAIPQGIAYAAIAGLPLGYGIYGTAIAAIAGALFSGSKYIALGPTNATAVMVLSSFAMLGIATEDAAAANAALLILVVGVLLLLGSVLRLANLVPYISRTVITGYISAAAALIVANQLRRALGFDFSPEERHSVSTFFEIVYHTARHIGQTHWPTLALSLLTLAIYLVLAKYAPKLPRVAIALIGAALAAAALEWAFGNFQVAMLPTLDARNWGLTLPPFAFDTLHRLLSPAMAIALLCMLEGSSIGKSLAARDGARINGHQELFSVGMANIACALFSGMAASGSLTRSQLNVDSGARTPMASLYVGLIIGGSAFLLSYVVHYIPISSLAVVVVAIAFSLINTHNLKLVTRTTRSDKITFYVTFLSGLILALDFAIYVGTVCSIALFLKKVASPEIVEYGFDEAGQLGQLAEKDQRADPEVSIVHVEGELFFGAAELFRDQMRRVSDDPNLKIVVMKLRNAHNLDATSCMALEELIRYMKERDRILLVSEVRPDTMRIIKNSGLIEAITPVNLFEDEETNPTLSTAKALKRAKQILGGLTPKVSIYAKEKRS